MFFRVQICLRGADALILATTALTMLQMQGLMDGLKQTNWMQDTILEEMQVGRTGNEVLAAFDARMKAKGIDGKMYSHAIGDHGHAAGPTIGLADMDNQPVPVKVRVSLG